MFPLHLLLSPHSTVLGTLDFPGQSLLQPVNTRLPDPLPAPAGNRKQRRAAWALTWIGPETAIVPPVGMNVPGVGR